jgi:hypothetical protein
MKDHGHNSASNSLKLSERWARHQINGLSIFAAATEAVIKSVGKHYGTLCLKGFKTATSKCAKSRSFRVATVRP